MLIKQKELGLMSQKSLLGFQVLYISPLAALWLDIAMGSRTHLSSVRITLWYNTWNSKKTTFICITISVTAQLHIGMFGYIDVISPTDQHKIYVTTSP